MRGIPLLLVILAGCSPKVAPPPAPPPAPIVQRVIIIQPAPVAEPRTPAGRAVAAFRQEEQKVSDSVGDPKRSADDIKRIYDAEQVAHVATQRLIDKGGRATKADEQAARAAIHDLRLARENQAVERRP